MSKGLFLSGHKCRLAQHSTAQHSTAQHSTAHHITAQHSTAQHSTAQHSTAQLWKWHFLTSVTVYHNVSPEIKKIVGEWGTVINIDDSKQRKRKRHKEMEGGK